MSRHISSASLSAYLDGEIGPSEEQRLAAHLAACAPCRSRLEATRRLVAGLQRTPPAPPPASLAVQIRERAAAEARARTPGTARWSRQQPPAPWLRRWLRSVRSSLEYLLQPASWWHGLPPLRSSFGAPLSAGLALLVAVLLLQNGESGLMPGLASPYPPMPRARPAFLVSEAFGDAPAVLPQTTSEVAGRVFVWSGDLWVQQGIDPGNAGQPRAVLARSPAGRALLAKFADLGVLLADGSRVVLRDNFETLELWNGS
jgi:Putative zinc-finger